MSSRKNNKRSKEKFIPRMGPPENLRPAGIHENTYSKKQQRKIKEALAKLDFDELEEL